MSSFRFYADARVRGRVEATDEVAARAAVERAFEAWSRNAEFGSVSVSVERLAVLAEPIVGEAGGGEEEREGLAGA